MIMLADAKISEVTVAWCNLVKEPNKHPERCYSLSIGQNTSQRGQL